MWRSIQRLLLKQPFSILQKCERTIVSKAAMGIVQFEERRTEYKERSQDFEVLKSHLSKLLDDSGVSKIMFTEDFKVLIYRCQATPEDLNLLLNLSKKYNSQNKDTTHASFQFGPEVMRLYHHLNQPDEALKALKDVKLEKFFNQITSYTVLLDLLYRSGRYEEVLDIYDVVQNRDFALEFFPQVAFCVTMGACLKLNTKESYERAKTFLDTCQKFGRITKDVKALIIASLLSLQQDDPQFCLEILGHNSHKHYLVRNLKVLAFLKIGRPEDAIHILSQALNMIKHQDSKKTFFRRQPEICRETLDTFRKYVATECLHLKENFDIIAQELVERNAVWEKTIEQCLTTMIENERKPTTVSQSRNEQRNRLLASMSRQSYQGYNYNQKY